MAEPFLEQIRQQLWNDTITSASYATEADGQYQRTIFEQYKIYVEMADHISTRRGLTNTFFLTLNTLVFTALGVFWKERPGTIPSELAFLVMIVLLSQSVVWWSIVRSYRQLNSGKYKVVGLLEERLPAAPYSRAEWQALGEGKDVRVYWPLTHIEQWVPVLFAIVYVVGFVLVVRSS